MARILATLVFVTTALWLGGMIFLFISVQTLFSRFPRSTTSVAVQAAPELFGVFEKYQLVLAAVALTAAFAWYVAARARWIIAIFVLLAIAAVGAVVSYTLITPRIEQLRLAGQSGSPRFARLHARSMQCYVTQAALLMGATLALPMAATRRTTTEASAG
jgi:hypothetical protein